MMTDSRSHGWRKDSIVADVMTILNDITALEREDGFAETIGLNTGLIADLGLTSSDLVDLALTLEQHFDRQNLPFYQLFMDANGRYVEDIRVLELVDFLTSHLIVENKGMH